MIQFSALSLSISDSLSFSLNLTINTFAAIATDTALVYASVVIAEME
jgi:hypothetical protein